MGGPKKPTTESSGGFRYESGSSVSSGDGSSSAPPSRQQQQPTNPRVAKLQGDFDGSRDQSPHGSARGGSAPPSQPGSPRVAPSSAPGSPRSTAAGSTSAAASTAGSSARPANARAVVEPKNFDLGVQGWNTVRGYNKSTSLPPRPPTASKLGMACKIGLNTFNVTQHLKPDTKVYQYEVMIGSGTEKRGLIRAIWESNAMKVALGNGFIFDGNRLAWSSKKLDRELRLIVDMDQERKQTPKPGKEDKIRVMIRLTNPINFASLEAYLDQKVDFNNDVLEAINFFDHLLREHPSSKFTQIKRNFFYKGEKRFDLTKGIEAMKGVYSSLRMVNGPRGACLSINVDVANGTFFNATQLHVLAQKIAGCRDPNDLIQALKQGERGRAGQNLKKLRRVHVVAKHRKGESDNYCIERIVYQGARDAKFKCLDPVSNKEVTMSVYDYFAKKYNHRLVYPDLPLVKMTKGQNTILPMEVLMVKENQRYPFKLDEKQTSEMIKFAVTPPAQRWAAIQDGLKMLDWANDPVMKHFGLSVSQARTVVDARVLTAPTVKYGAGDAKPGTSGRWDLKGKKFLQPNPAPLKCWSICVASGRRGGKPDKTTIENFTKEFIKIYIGHGGRVENRAPATVLAAGDDVGAWVTTAWNAAGNQSQLRPQIIVFILPDKDSVTYGRIKRSAECRYGVVTQCMQYSHVQKAQAQYISNVCMKFNAKLGGTTCRAIGAKSGGPNGLFNVPTMIIGADVSHAAPGSQAGSMAALTVSMDSLGCRYAVFVETNGYRVEMITKENIDKGLKPLIQAWMAACGQGKFPQRIIYIRDGVSEGQYAHVLDQEVADMKALLKSANASLNIPFVVIIAGKRHHIRFFPEKGDRNGNPLPGTLVESGVTHPFENDFYLCAHAAIKGTARPTHYHVLMNEANMSNDEIQTLLYEHSYQYMRATTPVSIHPAVYYAHIASARAMTHDPKWANSTDGQPGQTQGKQSSGPTSGKPVDVDALLPMPNQGGINTAMWYI